MFAVINTQTAYLKTKYGLGLRQSCPSIIDLRAFLYFCACLCQHFSVFLSVFVSYMCMYAVAVSTYNHHMSFFCKLVLTCLCINGFSKHEISLCKFSQHMLVCPCLSVFLSLRLCASVCYSKKVDVQYIQLIAKFSLANTDAATGAVLLMLLPCSLCSNACKNLLSRSACTRRYTFFAFLCLISM